MRYEGPCAIEQNEYEHCKRHHVGDKARTRVKCGGMRVKLVVCSKKNGDGVTKLKAEFANPAGR